VKSVIPTDRLADPCHHGPYDGPENKKAVESLWIQRLILHLAERTGLEPATPGVTGRYSNQLNYRSRFLHRQLVLTSCIVSNCLPSDADVFGVP
jgi:hypothetical protein